MPKKPRSTCHDLIIPVTVALLIECVESMNQFYLWRPGIYKASELIIKTNSTARGMGLAVGELLTSDFTLGKYYC
jgi:hypothetical protein